jgi:hypothetical protein
LECQPTSLKADVHQPRARKVSVSENLHQTDQVGKPTQAKFERQ